MSCAAIAVAAARGGGGGLTMSYAKGCLSFNNSYITTTSLSNNRCECDVHVRVGGGGYSSESEEDPIQFHLPNINNNPAPAYKWRLLIAYDGTRFSGWQYQQSSPSIHCTMENALTQVTKLDRKDLLLVGASRTDKGVHAWGQVAHFITPVNNYNLDSFHSALNGLLPPAIRVREIIPAVPEFHARFSVQSKIYHYKIYSDTIMDPFQRDYAYHTRYKLNAAAMREAAKHFLGNHDFSTFVNASQEGRLRDPVKTIFRFDVIEMGALLQLEVEGSGFLYRQVRNMVVIEIENTFWCSMRFFDVCSNYIWLNQVDISYCDVAVALLLQIGKEAIPPDSVPQFLASKDRKVLAKYALSAPPHGLCLVSIKYNQEHLRLPTDCPATSFGRHRTITYCKLPFY